MDETKEYLAWVRKEHSFAMFMAMIRRTGFSSLLVGATYHWEDDFKISRPVYVPTEEKGQLLSLHV